MKIEIELNENEYKALSDMAQQELRTVENMAKYWIIQLIKVPDEQSVMHERV